MKIDEALYKLPVIGSTFSRMHAYFKTQITVTDLVHVLVGLGVGMIIGNQKFITIGVLAIVLGAIYHLYAFINSKKL